MKVVVFGVNYDNKGSWAMLLALESFLVRRHDEVKFVIIYDSFLNESAKNAGEKYMMFQGPASFIGWLKFLLSIVLFKLGFNKGARVVDEIYQSDLVIDLSGFALTEDFSKNSGTRRSAIMLIQAVSSKILGKRYILGPQAIGPITRIVNVFIVNLIFFFSSKVFYRGQLRVPIYGSRAKLVSCPDITALNSFQSLFNQGLFTEESSYVLVNPNSRMFVKNGENYITEMLGLLEVLIERGKKVILTPNEIRSNEFDDLDLCYRLKKELNSADILINQDVSLSGLFSLIDKAEFVIASRFHIMMFSLIRVKRVLVSSWSKKYLDIMQLYGQSEFCFDKISTLTHKIQRSNNFPPVFVDPAYKDVVANELENTLERQLLK